MQFCMHPGTQVRGPWDVCLREEGTDWLCAHVCDLVWVYSSALGLGFAPEAGTLVRCDEATLTGC